jgi:hypothetical protein
MHLAYRLYASGQQVILVSVGALMAGVIFEYKRLAQKWSTVWATAAGSLLVSFLVFLPIKSEQSYQLEQHLAWWPYAFLFFFILAAIAFHAHNVTPKLTEGLSLLQSLAVVYWVMDYGWLTSTSPVIKILLLIGLFFSAYSFWHAFSYCSLSSSHRLVLSLWSSLVMALFAVDNVYSLYQQSLQNTVDLTKATYFALHYFLLGVSSMYMVQNLFLLTGFLPGKTTFFNAQYSLEVQLLKQTHIQRYSDRQVPILYSLFCLLFAGTAFGLNYHFQLLPRNSMIGIVFVSFPCLLALMEYAFEQTTATPPTNSHLPFNP